MSHAAGYKTVFLSKRSIASIVEKVLQDFSPQWKPVNSHVLARKQPDFVYLMENRANKTLSRRGVALNLAQREYTPKSPPTMGMPPSFPSHGGMHSFPSLDGRVKET